MSELPFERSFRTWCEREGVEWRTLRYPRPEARGETQAHRLSPRGTARGGVLVVHGAGNDALFSLTGVFTELLLRGFEVFAFDVDGHGRESTTRLFVECAGDSVPAALDAWGAATRDLVVHALGVSLGGSLLLHALPALDARIASATLICAPLRVELSWRSLRREVGMPMLRTLWRERSRFGLTGLVPSFGPFRRDLYPLRLGDPPGPGAFGYVEVINRLLERLELCAVARRVTVPVLLIYGARDLLVPSPQGQTLAGEIPSSELLLLQGDTHLSAPLAPVARGRLLGWIDQHHPATRSTA